MSKLLDDIGDRLTRVSRRSMLARAMKASAALFGIATALNFPTAAHAAVFECCFLGTDNLCNGSPFDDTCGNGCPCPEQQFPDITWICSDAFGCLWFCGECTHCNPPCSFYCCLGPCFCCLRPC